MAKESMKAREVKRARMVAKYAAKRAELKKIIATTDDPAESAQPLQDHRPSQRIHPPVRTLTYPVPRDGFRRSHPGCEEG